MKTTEPTLDRVVVIASFDGSKILYRTSLEIMNEAREENPGVEIEDISVAVEMVYGDEVNWQEMDESFSIEVSESATRLMPQ